MEPVQLSENTIRLLRVIIDERGPDAYRAGVIPDYDRVIFEALSLCRVIYTEPSLKERVVNYLKKKDE